MRQPYYQDEAVTIKNFNEVSAEWEKKQPKGIGLDKGVRMSPCYPLARSRDTNKRLNTYANVKGLVRNIITGKVVQFPLERVGQELCVSMITDPAKYVEILNQRGTIRTEILQITAPKISCFCAANVTWLRMVG